MTIILTKDGIKNTRRIVIDNSLNMSRIANDNNILEFHTQGLRLPRFDNTFHQNYNFVDTSRNGVIYLDDSDNKFKFVQNDNRVTVDNSSFDNGVSSISLGDSGKSIIFNLNGKNRMKMDASGVHLNEGTGTFITHPQDGLITGNIGIEDKIVFYNSNNVETSQMHYDSNAIIFESSNNHFDFKVGSGKIVMTIQNNEILHINSTGVGHNLNGNTPSNTLDISGNVSINYTGNSILNNKFLYSKGGIGIGVTCGSGQSLNINNKCIVETNGDISFSDLSCNYIRVNDLKPQELLFDDGNDSSFNITNRLVFSTKTNNHNTLFRATNANNDDAYYFSTYNNNFSLYSNGYHRIFGDSTKMIEYNKESNESMIIGPTSINNPHLYDLNSNTTVSNWKITDCSFGFKSGGGWNGYRRTNTSLLTNAKTDTITHYKSNAFDISSGIIQNKYDNLVMNVTNSTTKKFIFNNDLEISGNLTINSGVINITRNNVYIYSEFSINSESNPSIEINKNTVDSGYYLQASKNNDVKVNVSKLGMGVSPDGNNSTSASSDYVLDVSGEVYGLYPVGSVIMLEPTQSVPSGWALCDGSTLTRNSYVDLSNVIGSKYGGNATNITLPNFNDSMPMGNNPASGTTFESQSGSNEITENHMPSHTHGVAYDNNFDISLNKTNMEFGNTLFTQKILENQEHANWNYGNAGESVYNDAMNVESNTGQGLKYITANNNSNVTGEDGTDAANTIPQIISTQQGVFKGQTKEFPIHYDISNTNANNNSGDDFIPSYATIKFIIYHGVH